MANNRSPKRGRRPSGDIFPVVRTLTVLCLVGFIVFIGVRKGYELFKDSSYFLVKEIVSDSPKLNLSRLSSLKGQSLWDVDIRTIEGQMRKAYPQLSDIRVVRRFPDTVEIAVDERRPFVRAVIAGTNVVVDDRGCVIARSFAGYEGLLLVSGILSGKSSTSIGGQISKDQWGFVHDLVTEFARQEDLADDPIAKIDVTHMSKISLTLASGLEVIVESKGWGPKLKLLGVIRRQSGLDLAKVKYVDLRFEEPVIKERDEKR